MALPASYQLPLFPNYKTCVVCLRMLAPEAFYVRQRNQDGRENTCKECFRARSSAYYQRHREACNADARVRYRQKRVNSNAQHDGQVPAPLPQEKVCAVCRQVLPLSDFYRKRGTADGLTNACAECLKQRARAWYRSHRAACLAAKAAHGAAHREQVRATRRAAYERRKAEQNAQRRARYALNAEQERAVMRAYRVANPERFRRWARSSYTKHHLKRQEGHRAWRRAHPHKSREYSRRSYKTDKGKQQHRVDRHLRRARERGAQGSFTVADVRGLYVTQAGLCAYCAVALENVFHVDHMTPLSRGGSNWPDNLALACDRCNRRKWSRTAEEFRALRADKVQ